MLWELIATICAGLAGAGIALFIRKLSLKKAPKWLVPTFAGIGMLSFQIQSEYTWYEHQASLLPEGVVVVKTVEEEAPWRPWSMVYPQTTRFIAADINNAAQNDLNHDVYLVDLYFFERRLSAKRVTQVIHCGAGARTNFTNKLEVPTGNQVNNSEWVSLPNNDPLLTAVCDGRAS
ncbi:hypothetical protein [Marinomonas communis]|jgi:hypothetical protein|uniref:Uncharacterized protein n=1 Tax=Marinomonas communis TaxID=28254 RepID=A0A4R6X9F5_9GAMM|nr:hypothetical protein [Marinomonas communis]MCC4272920.1 hypothetical protein [Marinomonas communis]RUM52767.1 MAG: hypothetical protein DSY85_10015 [Marinomonas sp.]TDR15766.1 hypothetical protein C8D85_1140 [Marinomonas communis]